MKLLLGIATVTILTACASGHSSAPRKSDAEVYFDSQTTAAASQLAQLNVLREKHCDADYLSNAMRSINNIEARISSLSNSIQDRSRFNSIERDIFRKRRDYGLAKHLTLAFFIADDAMQFKCYDIAEQAYNNIIKFYIGHAYAGYRDRAMAGLNKINSLK